MPRPSADSFHPARDVHPPTRRDLGPAGRLGLPTSGEYATSSGRASNLQFGRLDWNAGTGVVTG